jgi:hypothetical protein
MFPMSDAAISEAPMVATLMSKFALSHGMLLEERWPLLPSLAPQWGTLADLWGTGDNDDLSALDLPLSPTLGFLEFPEILRDESKTWLRLLSSLKSPMDKLMADKCADDPFPPSPYSS